MGFFEWLRSIFSPPTPVVGKRVALTTSEPKAVPAGRTSFDTEKSYLSKSTWTVQPPPDYESSWRMLNLDVEHLDQFLPKELLDMLIDLSPEISRAVWDFQRLFNPGWEVKAFVLGSEDKEHLDAKAHIDEFFERLRQEYGSIDILWGRFSMGAYVRGGICSELVLDGDAFESIDWVAPDPYSIRFRKKVDSLRGEIWQPGQWQGTKFVPLDIPTFAYLPVDPACASPYGRPLAAPALFTAIFILGLLHDVKRVVMQQGYKRMDITVNTEAARDLYTFDDQGFATFSDYIRAAIDAVKAAYRVLEPDDAFIHSDLFTLNPPAGTLDSDSISAIAQILDHLEKMATRALKTTSLLLETGNSPSETDSNRRWEIHAAGIKSIQHLCENMIEKLLQVSLQAKGIQARVRFRFAELRASEMLRDEQTRQLKIQNSVAEYQAGYTSQDESSNNAVNHDADVPEPRGSIEDNIQDDNNDGDEALDRNRDDREVPLLWQEAVLP